MVIGRAVDRDDFDHWVSGRIESEVAATNSSSQYVNSPNYTAGFADLYTFGSWFSMGGYGNCWRPFGAGLGWSPFSFGDWYSDPVFGSTFIGPRNGLAALSLWWLDLLANVRLVLEPAGFGFGRR